MMCEYLLIHVYIAATPHVNMKCIAWIEKEEGFFLFTAELSWECNKFVFSVADNVSFHIKRRCR